MQPASKANQEKVIYDQHPRRTKPKIRKKEKIKNKKKEKRKKKKEKIRKRKRKRKKGFIFSSPGQNVRLLSLPYS